MFSRFEARRFHDVGEAVIAGGHFWFRHRTTGKGAEADGMARLDVRGGRISGGRFYEDTCAAAARIWRGARRAAPP